MKQTMLAVAALTALTLTGCADDPEQQATPPPATTVPTIDQSAQAAAEAAAGIPPIPSDAAVAGYLSALQEVEPELVERNSTPSLINRGRDQCKDLKDRPEAEWDRWLSVRFSTADRPEGLGAEANEQILAAIRKFICPTF